MKIFIVEDNPLYAAVLEQNLKNCGYYDIQKFNDGERCIKSIDQKPEVILLDYELGINKFNGIDIIRELRKRTKQTKILLLSGQNDIQIAVDSLQLGAFDYIIKGKYAMDHIVNSLHKIRTLSKMEDSISQNTKLNNIFYAGIIGFCLLVLITYGFVQK